MKKAKKDKKTKVEKKSKLNGWLSALGVFAGVTLISGATVLGVYLTGGFEEKVIMPESIAFEYDASLFDNGQLEVSATEPLNMEEKQTFLLKITSPTERVTKDKVTLSFVGQDSYNTPDAMGYISNTIIRLPQVVTIGQSFEVELLKEDLKESETSTDYVLDENGEYIDWIKGGISTIYAQSQDNQQSPISLKVAVDVPVYKTETQIINSRGQITDEVVTNETFTLQSKFIPAKSQYMFSDDKSGTDASTWRTKKTFFESANTTTLTPIYQDKYTISFNVGNESASNVEIDGYTYKTARAQLDYEKTLDAESTAVDYYIRMLENIAGKTVADDVAIINFAIKEANVGNYTVSRATQTLDDVKIGQTLRLFINKYDYYANSDFLGVDVYSTKTENAQNGVLLDGMLKNIAIAFEYNGTDATTGANASLTVNGGDYYEVGGLKYYKPISSVANPRYSFWDIETIKAQSLTIKTMLLVDNGDGLVPFEIGDEIVTYPIYLNIVEHTEADLAWADMSDINVMLDYDTDGSVIPQTIDLASLTNVPTTNLYQDVIFFACFGTQDKSAYQALADSVLGSSGYNYDKSGVYSTENGNFTLFALEGDSLTLYSTGEFTLYYATVATINGQYQYDADGLYQIVLMCEGSVRVSCEKSLNEDSVTSGILNTDNFTPGENGEVSINQGSDLSFSVKFAVSREAVPVFEDEYRRGHMTPSILDNANNDITNLFIIDSENFVVDGESGDGILEYRFKVKSAVQIDSINGVYFGYVALSYDDQEGKTLEWEYSLGAEQNVCVYKPLSISINVSDEGGYEFGNVLAGITPVTVSQTLQADGEFIATIKVMVGGSERQFTSVGLFLEALLGANNSRVIITDQKGRTDTLAGQWSFVVSGGNSSIISISADGKSFTFKNTNENGDNVALTITSNDKEVSIADKGQSISFSIISTGVTHIAYADSPYTYDDSLSAKTENITKASVQKYGAVGGADDYITLSNMVKFYIGGGTQEYTRVSFKFNPQYISESTLSNTQLTDLFGLDGMLTLYGEDGAVIDFNNDYATSNMRSVLLATPIAKLKINKNFALSPTLQFIVSDSISAVNTNLDLSLLANITVSAENYPLAGDVVYAGSEFTITSKVANINQGTDNGTFANSLYVDGTLYYVVYNNDRYVLTDTLPASGAYIATFTQGKIKFVDFWDVETNTFRVYFQPEGANYYALNHGITFTVTRDLNIQSKNGTFYVLSTNISSPLDDYVSVTRKSSGSTIPELSLNYSFNDYLDYDNGKVVKKTGSDFFFGYNIDTLSSVLTITLPASGTVLSQIPVNIKLYQTDDIYREIANAMASKTASADVASVKAQTQIVGDTKYMMVDVSGSASWQLGFLGTYYLKPSQRDFFNINMNDYYEVSGVSDLTINFTSQSKLLAGLNDTNVYMVIKVYASKDSNVLLATVHVPMIVSMIGYESVVYEGEQVELNRKLETALSNPEKLLEAGIYNTITAGKLTQILSTYTYDQTPTAGGLYILEGFMPTVKYYAFDTSVNANYSHLIKETTIQNTYCNLSLNHLAKGDEAVYIAFTYTIEKSDVGIKETFYTLYKVTPDAIVGDAVYAYNGNAEYLESEKNIQGQLALDTLYSEETLNEGYKRFNVDKEIYLAHVGEDVIDEVSIIATSQTTIKFTYNNREIIKTYEIGEITVELGSAEYFDEVLSYRNPVQIMIMAGEAEISYNGEKVFKTLKYQNAIYSVKVGDEDAITDPAVWEEKVSLSFSADYSILYYRPKVENKIEIVVKHSYLGSASVDDLAVVDGEQYYTIILNGSSSNFTVRFDDDGTSTITDEYVVSLNNGDHSSYSMSIFLIENDTAGSSSTGTIVPDLLNIQYIMSQEEKEGGFCYIAEENFDESGAFKGYNRTTGAFTVVLNEYLDADQKVYFALFTEQGGLATLVLDLKANANYALKDEYAKAELAGGTKVPFADIFTINLDGEENTEYTVTATPTAGDIEFVYWTDGQIAVAPLIADKQVTFDFVIEFNGANAGKVFKFSHEFTLKTSITAVSSYTSTIKVIAGEEHTLELANLYTGTIPDNTTLNIAVESSSPAYNGITKVANDWIIQTKYVSSSVTLTLNVTVSLHFHTGATQSFAIAYSLVVEPSVMLTSNYPIPNDTSLTFEYVEEGANFANILTNFFGHAPIFNDTGDSRLVIKNGTTAGVYDSKVDFTTLAEKPTIVVSNLQNASLAYADGHYLTNSAIASDANITFKRGTYNQNSGLYADAGTDAYVEFTITYQEVSVIYKVYILKNSLTIKRNLVSNFVSSGEVDGETENYETVYIDKTSTADMFAGGRLVYAELADTMANFSNEYYLVFKNGATYYASYPIYLAPNDQGKNLYYDLGYSMTGYEFVGAYLTSNFEDAGLGAQNNAGITINTEIAGADASVEGQLATITNFALNLFENGVVSLANRIQLVYGQLDGKDILVDYNWYADSVNNLNITSSTYTIDTIYGVNPMSSFDRQDGSNNANTTFTVKYYFKPSIDIDVAQKASESINYLQLEVNKENLSMANLFGVHHPTNNKVISPSDFATDTTSLQFEVLDYTSGNGIAIADAYIATSSLAITSFKKTSNGDANNIYLFYAGVENASGNICDYALLALGAKNSGDFVLTKITYTSSGFTKEFYVVVKILPDYVVAFGESVDNATTEDDGSISNINNIRIVADIEPTLVPGEFVFSDFAMTGEGGYLSIKHKNGSSTNVELSAINFATTMEVGYRHEATEYNNETNIEEKIFFAGSANLDETRWSATGTGYKLASKASAVFTGVKQVIFGNQYYMISGVDPYGYVYKLYFILQASDRTPVVEGTISLIEDGYFDIGVQYQQLSIEEDNGAYYINSLPSLPASNDGEVKLINIQGIEAWLFNKDYSAEGECLIKNADGGYSPKDATVVFDDADKDYLLLPKLATISIDTIKFYNPDTGEELETLTKPNAESDFATAESGTAFFHGITNRGVYTKTATDEGGNPVDQTDKLWYVPRLSNTDIFAGTNTADITLVITLKYSTSGMTEYYDCHVNVNLIRALAINQVEATKIAQDAQAIRLNQQFEVPYVKVDGGVQVEGDYVADGKATFINDTIEVLVDENNTATFEMTLSRSGSQISSASVTLQNAGRPYAKTSYISLSQYFGVNVQAGDEVKITYSNNASFFYITTDNAKGTISGTQFTIGAITNDYVYVENQALLGEVGYYNVRKYYIMNCVIDGSVYSYQVSRDYVVTGYYYTMVQEYITEIGFAMNPTGSSVTLANWKGDAFTLRSAEYVNGSVRVANDNLDAGNLMEYSIDNTTGTISGMTIGSATIDNNSGTITLGNNFNENQYIKVVLHMAVSGANRILAKDGDASYYYLGTLNLSTKRV